MNTLFAIALFSLCQGFDDAKLDAVRAFADEKQSAAVIVVSHGNVVAAWGAVDRKLELHSVRKSLYAAMWGIAEARGLVKLDATLADLGIDDLQPLTAEEKKARLIDLLHARSGVYHPSADAPSDQQEALPPRGSHPPDTFWFYNNWDFNVSGALLEKVGGKPLGVLFDEWIAKPTGMEDFTPEDVFAFREPGVSRWPALTFRISARDLARFGQLWLDRGRWEGKQIVPAAWIERAWTPASNTGEPGQGYGVMWWTYDAGSLNAQRYPNASRYRINVGRGTGGQGIVVIPEADLVIVHRADTDHGRQVSGRDIWSMIDQILGARTAPEVKPVAFASQLPAFEWPEPIALASFDAFVGSYDIGRGMTARVFVDRGKLYAFMPGKGEAELFAISPTEFYVRVDPTARLRFDGNRVIATIRGREIIGTRKE